MHESHGSSHTLFLDDPTILGVTQLQYELRLHEVSSVEVPMATLSNRLCGSRTSQVGATLRAP